VNGLNLHHTQYDEHLTWLLQGLVERVPRTRGALLLTTDGLKKAVHELDTDTADQMAAVTSGLCSLAQGAAVRLGDDGPVRQVVVELHRLVLLVCTAGDGSRLAVVADREADLAVLGYEMAQLAKSVGAHLATPARQPAPDNAVPPPTS